VGSGFASQIAETATFPQNSPTNKSIFMYFGEDRLGGNIPQYLSPVQSHGGFINVIRQIMKK
jgi:hypothetical protein